MHAQSENTDESGASTASACWTALSDTEQPAGGAEDLGGPEDTSTGEWVILNHACINMPSSSAGCLAYQEVQLASYAVNCRLVPSTWKSASHNLHKNNGWSSIKQCCGFGDIWVADCKGHYFTIPRDEVGSQFL